MASAASATKLGELFQYTVGSVTLPRQKSAMIPVVTDPVEVEKLSIYNQSVLPKNPLYGARLKNTTGKHLLQGPITVLQGGSYAGDAKIAAWAGPAWPVHPAAAAAGSPCSPRHPRRCR